MKLKTYIKNLIRLVKKERDEEISATFEEIKKLSGKERERLGKAILNLKGKIIGEELGYKLIKFGRKKEIKTEIAVGDLVLISKGLPLKSDFWGTVTEKGKRFLVVAVERIPDFNLSDIRIDLFANDITFRRQIENLKNLTPWGAKALGFALGKKPKKSFPAHFRLVDKTLNHSQRKAVAFALGSEDFFLIHGPFGTGKTKTLAELAIQEAKRGKKVLVAAESNVAVDNLVERLFKKIDVVRIGHPSRVSKNLKESTLAFQVEKTREYEIVVELKKMAEALILKRISIKKPTPATKRGLKEERILKLARKGKVARGLSLKTIKEMARYISLSKEIKSLLDEAKAVEDIIIQKVIEKKPIVLATNSSSALEFLKNIEFDVALVDEASQATIPSTLIPLSKAKKFVLVGDHKQLPPTILSLEAQELSQTLFEKLISRFPQKAILLDVQYRMNELLMSFPNYQFYGGEIKAAPRVKNITLKNLKLKPASFPPPWNLVLKPENVLVFIDTSQKENKFETQRRGSTSKENHLEANLTKNLVRKLLKMGLKEENLGIIAPYDDQVDLIRSLLETENIEVNTVDGYQGREKEVIILSFVRSNKEREIGFLEDLRRLNVALTRPKRKLIAIGDSETLSSHKTYRDFINFVKKKGLYLCLK